MPGGYINLGETWQQAGAREVAEETGVRLDSASIHEFGVRSAPDGTVLIFGLSHPIERAAVDAFQPTAETAECRIIHAPVDGLAFSLHSEMVSAYFNERTNAGLS